MYALIEKWHNSDKTQQAVCREHGCSYESFKYWRKKQIKQQAEVELKSRTSSPEDGGNFITLSAMSEPAVPELQIIYPNGVQIKCAAGSSSNQITYKTFLICLHWEHL